MIQEKLPTMLEQGVIYSSLDLFAVFNVDNVACPPGN